jgi:PAS domain S-box-containing protein
MVRVPRVPSLNLRKSSEVALYRTIRDLKQKLHQTQAAFDSVGEGVVTTDKSGIIRQINPAGLKILGYKEREVVGQWFQKVLVVVDENGQEVDLMHRPYTQATLSRKSVTSKIYYRTKSGGSVPVVVTVSNILTNGRPNGAVEIFRDITNEQEFDQLKSEFISLASHQLRTPLTAISTYTHMLIGGFKGDMKDGQLEFLNTILASADRMSNLIDTLLSVSRLESGSIGVNISNVNATQVVSKAKQELWPLAKAKRQFLITKAPDEEVFIHTDELLLTEVCTNLISNAIKYTPAEGKITIELKTTNQGITLSVNDTGYGIPAHLQRRVFSKFFRAPNILHEESVGTGLGLYLVKEITDSIGGTIWFKSKENKGSNFIVNIPDRPAKQTAPARAPFH